MGRGEISFVGPKKVRRPVLIVWPEAFNRITKVPVVLPITSGGNFARTAGFALPLTKAGTKTTGVVRCDQPRALDLTVRGGKRSESVPEAIMDEVLARIAPIFEERVVNRLGQSATIRQAGAGCHPAQAAYNTRSDSTGN
jgi:mRNA-degrading endonuclease toxin of MazEF toxin-antitoxin module